MQVSIKANTFVYLAVLLFILPIRWICAWLFAVVFHEICHWCAVKVCGGSVYSFEIGLGGADMKYCNLTDGCSIFAILSGPVGGLLFSCFGWVFPRIALCSFALSVYNLLPLLPYDGGHALQILMKNNRVYDLLQRIFLILLLFAGLVTAIFLRLGIIPLIIVFQIWIKNRKIPCKEACCKVQ